MVRHRKEDNSHHSTQAPVGFIERFFESFSNFQYSPSNPSAEEYQRLRKSYGWRRGNPEGNRAWSGFRLALVKEFNRLFGTDPSDLLAWQTLCTFIGIRERFTTCDGCIQSLKSRHFNIVDVIDTRRRGNGIAQVFPTRESLEEYTKRTASYFPYDSRKAGKLLRMLLRKRRENTITNVNQSPLFPPPSVRDGRHEALPTLSNRETRSAKRRQLITASESAEVTNNHSYVEFESE